MALGKTIAEIRAMPYAEFLDWQTYYLLEPFGWHEDEYRFASILAMLVNVNASKKSSMKNTKDFTRNMLDLINKAYRQAEQEDVAREKYLNASREEKAKMIASAFGSKDVNIGNRRNNMGKIKP